jgi:hypothetical protein
VITAAGETFAFFIARVQPRSTAHILNSTHSNSVDNNRVLATPVPYQKKGAEFEKLVKHGNLSSSHVCLLLGVLYIWVLKITAECKFCYQCVCACVCVCDGSEIGGGGDYIENHGLTRTVKKGP